MESTWRNFLVYFEGTLWTRISLREKGMNIMPTPLRVGGILCYVGQILAQLNHGRIPNGHQDISCQAQAKVGKNIVLWCKLMISSNAQIYTKMLKNQVTHVTTACDKDLHHAEALHTDHPKSPLIRSLNSSIFLCHSFDGMIWFQSIPIIYVLLMKNQHFHNVLHM